MKKDGLVSSLNPSIYLYFVSNPIDIFIFLVTINYNFSKLIELISNSENYISLIDQNFLG